jgi:hypothetical protein
MNSGYGDSGAGAQMGGLTLVQGMMDALLVQVMKSDIYIYDVSIFHIPAATMEAA